MDGKLREPERLALFPEFATRLVGSVWASTLIAGLLAVLVVGGVVTGFPHGWQAFVHTAGALLSVLLLFLLQHTTNRETKAILVKLDELIQSSDGARNHIMGLENEQLDNQEKVQDRLHRDGATN
jgi:low affinity Fe/Cu permease